MKKILFYTDTPLVGGAEKHMLLLAQNINAEAYEVRLICSNYKQLNEWARMFQQSNIKVYRLKVSHKHDPRHLFQLKKIFAVEKPDILHLHLWNPASCRYAFIAANKKIKIITTEHDPFALKGLKKILKKKFLKQTAHTITVSKANEELMLQLYPEVKNKITTIPNGLDIAAFEKQILHFSQQEKTKIRTQLFGATNNDFIIMTVATLHPRKGLMYLLEAFSEVIKERPEAKLILVGEGPERKKIEKKIKNLEIFNKVVLLGQQDNIPKLLKSSDLFVLPSMKEAFGLVLLEAMAAHLPIIATNVGGIPEIIQNHKNGELVEAKNSKALAEKILELIKNKPLREKLSFIGQHEVKKFDIKEMAKKTGEVYAEVSA